jgi:hypothetical protein
LNVLREAAALRRCDWAIEPSSAGSGPFGLVRFEKGYEIRSALKDDGKPEVTLFVGEPS